ncbi:unnamed protein product [Rotaria socialis]|nr:unnamed protein product [Rotaria socialis]
MAASQNVCVVLSLVMKIGSTIYDPKMKCQSHFWVASNDPHPAKIRRQRSVGKNMFAIFFMKPGFNTIISLENGKTVTAEWCTNECLTQVPKQVEKHRRLNGLLIHHDNAPTRRTALTMEYLDTKYVKLIGHSAYSPDLSPCDFWLFPKIKEQFRGKNFQDINELDDAVRTQID